MSINDIPPEYMHCFNVIDEIPEFDPAEVEKEHQADLYETTALEWHECQPGIDEKKPVKEPALVLKRLMDLDSYRTFRKTAQETAVVVQQESTTAIQEVKSVSNSTTKTAATKNIGGPYRSYTSVQIQELLDLVIE